MRRRCAPGALVGPLSSDPSLFLEPQTIVARSNGGVGRARPAPAGRARASARARSRPTRGRRVPRRLHRRADGGSGRGHRRREPRRPRARRALQPLRLQPDAMRIAFDVIAALASAPRDRELHPGLARRSRRGRRGAARDRRVRADEHPRAGADPRGARGHRRRAAHVAAARSPTRCARHGAGSGHPAAERLLGAFDALHFSDWMYPPQRAGVRATTIHDLVPLHHPEWTTARTRSMHGRKYRNAAATCDVVFVNSAYTGRDVDADARRPGRAGSCRASRAEGRLPRRTAPAADLGAPYVLTVATLEPRKNLQVLVEAHRLLGDDLELAVVGGEGWGEQPLLDGAADPAPRVRLRRRARAPLPWCRRGRVSVALRGFRHPGASRRWRAASPSSSRRTSRWTRRAATPRVRADPEIPPRSPPRIERALRRSGSVSSARGSST